MKQIEILSKDVYVVNIECAHRRSSNKHVTDSISTMQQRRFYALFIAGGKSSNLSYFEDDTSSAKWPLGVYFNN